MYQDIALNELLEATHVSGQGISSRIHVVKEVAAFAVGEFVDFHVSGIILQDDSYAWNYGARRIAYHSLDSAPIFLCQSECCTGEKYRDHVAHFAGNDGSTHVVLLERSGFGSPE